MLDDVDKSYFELFHRIKCFLFSRSRIPLQGSAQRREEVALLLFVAYCCKWKSGCSNGHIVALCTTQFC